MTNWRQDPGAENPEQAYIRLSISIYILGSYLMILADKGGQRQNDKIVSNEK